MRQSHNGRDAFLFSLPFLVVYLAFLVLPIFYGIYLSFFDWNILSGKHFIGLQNFIDAFKDEKFLSSLWHTTEFVLISTPATILAGFLMALIVSSASRLSRTSETIFFMPYILSITVVGTLWSWIFQGHFGILNQVLQALGFQGVGWLTDPQVAMWSIAGATVWWTAGFNMILFTAGIRQIPDNVYEAAKLDGAGYFTTLFKITLPLLRNTSILVLILQVIASFKVFGQSYVMTGGGPFGSTRVLVQYIYESGFTYFKMGYASAMSILLFLIILVISIVQFALTKGDR